MNEPLTPDDRASAEGLRAAAQQALDQMEMTAGEYAAKYGEADLDSDEALRDRLRAALRDTGPRLTPDGYDQRSWEAGWNAALEDTPDRDDPPATTETSDD